MPLNKDIKKVLVIGSGPIVIGQAAEFDYAGAQACRVLRDEGIEVVLVNSNPATIMTDKALADHIYLEPLSVLSKKSARIQSSADSADRRGLLSACSLPRTVFLTRWELNFSEQMPRLSTRRKTGRCSVTQW